MQTTAQTQTAKRPATGIEKLMLAEIDLINKMLAAHRVQARTTRKTTVCVQSSFIAYGLQVIPGENVRKIEAIQRELSNALTRQRARLMRGYAGRAVVRLRDFPLAIEVPHPKPVSLSWQSAKMETGQFVALVGRSYGHHGPREEYLDLERHYHTLVAAMSGGGKSTLMRMALLTLAQNTHPNDLRIMLVDLKNDDLTVFRDLPHVISYAGDIDSAAEAIAQVHQIKTERIASQEKPYRLLLVIDELAELGQSKDTLRQLGSILSTGRSLGINVLAGTQYPTAATIGSVVNASFTVRLVGMVDGKTAAHTATKRAGSGAELLQTPGDFLRIDGQELVRMKAYDISQEDTAVKVEEIIEDWKKKEEEEKRKRKLNDYTSYDTGYDNDSASYDAGYSGYGTSYGGGYVPAMQPATGVSNGKIQFPIKEGRPLTESEAQMVCRLFESGRFDHNGRFSMNKAMLCVYGSRNPQRAEWIRQALEDMQL